MFLNGFPGPKKVGLAWLVRMWSGRNMVTAETVIRSVAGVHEMKEVRLRFQAITFT